MAFLVTGAIIAGGIAVAGGAAKLGMSLAGRRGRINEQRAAKAEFDKMKGEYENLDTSNLAAGFKNPYANMENTMEDLKVNTQQAEFQARRGLQNRVNILDSLRSAAGSSGIAGLAQTLANQGLIQTEKISASIGKQETANRLASAKGALQTELADAKGEFMVQNMEASRRATTLGMQQGVMAAAVGNEG